MLWMFDAIWYEFEANSDYLVFGTWLGDMDANGGNHKLHKFYAFSSNVPGSVVEAATGTATYKGHSMGYYVDDGSIYRFRSDVVITANFGTATEFGSLSGTVDNFLIEGATVNTLKDSSLNLSQAQIETEGLFAGSFSGSVAGSMTGTWSGFFVAPPGGTFGDLTPMGEYEASNADGAVLFGVFGAR